MGYTTIVKIGRERRLRALRSGLSVLAVVALMPSIAFAQTEPQTQPASDAKSENEIIVTGSRIQRAGFNAPSPVTMLGQDTIQARAATSVSSVIYEVPAVQPRPSPSGTSQLGGNFVSIRSIGGGAAGASRTLVLLDSHRFVPTNNQGQVDLNVIPSALVDRIDIVTAGASAAYGSDAITGVVNIILKKKLEGLSGTLQSGISDKGDGQNYFGALSWGTGFAEDRGQFLIAGEYSYQPDAITQRDRAYSRNRTGYVPNSNIPNQVTGLVRADGVTLTGFTAGGAILSANLGTPGRQFVSNGAGGVTVAPLNYGANVGGNFGAGTVSNNLATSAPANTQIGGDSGSLSDSLLLASPSERQTLFARASFEFSPAFKLWTEGSYSRFASSVDYQANYIRTNEGVNGVRESALIDNYDAAGVLTGQVPNPLLAGLNLGAGTFTIRRLAPELGAVHTDTSARVMRGAVGGEGEIAPGWRWNAYFQHGETKFSTDIRNNIIQPNLAAALDVVVYNGALACRINVPGAVIPGARADGSTPQTGASPGCVVANPIGPGSLTSSRNYITGTLRNIVDYKQDAGEASIQGSLFSIGAADPVSVVVGVDWRRDEVAQTVSALNNSGASIRNFSDFVNLNYPTGAFQQANPKTFRGSNSVKEAFGEIVVPVFADSAIGHSLDLNGAFRYTDYSAGGDKVTTYKIGGVYSPIAGLQFRATHSRDIRVGTLTQIFGNSAGVAVASPAPGSNVPAAANNVSYTTNNTAGTSLVPEKADQTTIGFSTSNLLPGFSFSVDLYRIKLRGGIANIGTAFVLNSCYGTGGATLDTALCNAYISDSAGNVGTAAILSSNPTKTLLNPQLNLQDVRTSGADIEVSQRINLNDLGLTSNGVVTVRMLASYVHELVFSQTGTVTADRAGDTIGSVPKWRWTLTGTYQNGPFTFNAQGRYIGALAYDNLANVTNPATGATYTNPATLPVGNRIPPVFYLNAGASIRIIDRPGRTMEFFANVNNLLDKDPPFTNTAGPGAAGGLVSNASAGSANYAANNLYEVIGRTYTAGVRFKF